MIRNQAGIAGVIAGAVALGVTEFAAGILSGGRSPFLAVGDAAIRLTPGPVVRFAIDTFASANRLVLFLVMAAVLLVVARWIGIAAARRRPIGDLGIAAVGALGVAAGLTDPLLPAGTAIAAPTLGAVAGIALLRRLLRASGQTVAAAPSGAEDRASTPVTEYPTDPHQSRRTFLRLAAAGAGGAAVAATTGRMLQQRARADEARLATSLPRPSSPVEVPPAASRIEVDGISPLITPNDDFFRIDTALGVPRVDPDEHVLRISGLVDSPFELDYEELLAEADTEAYVTLSCVSNEVGGDLVGHARWQGIPLGRLLDRAGVQAEATQIVGRSVDGWTSGFPVEAAFDGRGALVAVGMNGEPLPERHGFPVRLVIPGLYGYVSNTKWLAEIELTTFEAHDAYWIPRGWSAEGPIKTQSRIDVPAAGSSLSAGAAAVAGVAWADERGVSAVEVQIDDGPWQPAELGDELSSSSWRQWHLAWDASSGDHTLRVRAFDADGVPQTDTLRPPAPDGATGHHNVQVRVS
ncbi:MAG: molybdopterin-dependent oxidoreductase [Nitriliruptoraceae bacterium]